MGDWQHDEMATITNKRKVVSLKGKVKMIWQIENGKKKADVCQECGIVNSTIQMVWKRDEKLLVHLNRMDWA